MTTVELLLFQMNETYLKRGRQPWRLNIERRQGGTRGGKSLESTSAVADVFLSSLRTQKLRLLSFEETKRRKGSAWKDLETERGQKCDPSGMYS